MQARNTEALRNCRGQGGREVYRWDFEIKRRWVLNLTGMLHKWQCGSQGVLAGIVLKQQDPHMLLS